MPISETAVSPAEGLLGSRIRGNDGARIGITSRPIAQEVLNAPLKLLVIEDNPADFLLLEWHLRKQQVTAACTRVASLPELEEALAGPPWDAILADYNLPGMQFELALDRIQRRWPHLPVLLLSGSVGEERAVELLKLGVADFILKGNLARLVPAIARCLREANEQHERKQTEAALERERGFLKTLIQTLPDLIWLKDPAGVYLACNPRFEQFLGAREADILGKTDYDFVDRAVANFFSEKDRAAIAAGQSCVNEEELTFRDDGHRELVETIKTPMFNAEGRLIGVLGIARDITAARQTAAALRASEATYRSLFNHMLNGLCYCRMLFKRGYPEDFVYLNVNQAFTTLTGLQDVVGRKATEVIPGLRETDPELIEAYGRVVSTGQPE